MQYEYDDGLFSGELGGGGSKPRRGRGGGGWSGSLSQRVSAARGVPQAVFKISSYSHSGGSAWDRANYVGRDGELEVEAPNGEMVDQVALEQLVDKWSEEANENSRSRVAMSAMVAFPPDVDQEQATEAARQFFREAFADNHDYVFAAHTDAKHFHVHVVVQMAGHDGHQLRIGKDEIQDLRELFAAKAHEQGIELDASPRWARGLEATEKESRGAEARGRRRGVEDEQEKNKLTNGNAGPGRAERNTAANNAASQALAEERAKRSRNPAAGECQALEYGRAAVALVAKIPELTAPRDKVAAVKGAVQLAGFGWDLTEQSRDKAADIATARTVIDGVDKSINSQIRGLGNGPAQKEAITARRGLAEKLVEYRQEQREAAAQARRRAAEKSEGAAQRDGAELNAARQALKYAQEAGRLVVQSREFESDEKKGAGFSEAAKLAARALKMAETCGENNAEVKQTRDVVDKTERLVFRVIQRMEEGPAKDTASRADRELAEHLGAYRAEQAAKVRAAERNKEPEVER